MRRYRVNRGAIVQRIVDALERSGARVLSPPDPNSAPFEIGIETPEGERLELICYAFTANKYGQKNRPEDEHRFQVKYGSKLYEYHELHLDPAPERVTLFFGVGIDEDDGIFVACDPTMHNPTRFCLSVEFKTYQVKRALETGWYGWERDRSDTRRKQPKPAESQEVEALIAFTPGNFLRYVQLERIATGIAPGERLLIAERLAPLERREASPTREHVEHELEAELGYSAEEILNLLRGHFRLRAAARGAAAEGHLEDLLRDVPGVTRVCAIDEDAKPDFELTYRGRVRPVLLECKNVLRSRTRAGSPRVDFQKTRASRSDPCSRYYRPDQFDLLAACLHPISGEWEYRFRETRTMPHHPRCTGHLDHRVVVEGSQWTTSLPDLLEDLTA